jgi:hypothetical protein
MGGNGPSSGSVWGWFGGTSSDETASLSQTVTIPNGSANLEFYFWIGPTDPGSDIADIFTAKIDGVTVFSANATQGSSYSSYTLVNVDVSAYANGASHTISFSSVTTGQSVTFNLDDVYLLSVPAAPYVISDVLASVNPTAATSVNFTVTFSEPVTGVDTVAPFNDFNLTNGPGITGAFVTGVTPISGTTYTVSVNTGLGNGTIRLDVVDDNSIVDAASNPLGGAAVGDGDFTTGQMYDIEKLPILTVVKAVRVPERAAVLSA